MHNRQQITKQQPQRNPKHKSKQWWNRTPQPTCILHHQFNSISITCFLPSSIHCILQWPGQLQLPKTSYFLAWYWHPGADGNQQSITQWFLTISSNISIQANNKTHYTSTTLKTLWITLHSRHSQKRKQNASLTQKKTIFRSKDSVCFPSKFYNIRNQQRFDSRGVIDFQYRPTYFYIYPDP